MAPIHLIITMTKWIRTSRLSIKNSFSLAQRSASWLTRKALRFKKQVSICLDPDDYLRIPRRIEGTYIAGFGRRGDRILSRRAGCPVLFVADPEQPLDGNLYATFFRIASAKVL